MRDFARLRRNFHLFEENAVVQPLWREPFLQAVPVADLAAILFDHIGARHVQMNREAVDFDVADPDVSRRPGAAVAALAARELQPIAVPRFLLRRGCDHFQLHAPRL
jgi:hypothetical protein